MRILDEENAVLATTRRAVVRSARYSVLGAVALALAAACGGSDEASSEDAPSSGPRDSDAGRSDATRTDDEDTWDDPADDEDRDEPRRRDGGTADSVDLGPDGGANDASATEDALDAGRDARADAGDSGSDAAAPCERPRVTFLLSRARSMGLTLTGERLTNTTENRAQTKWSIALNALRDVVRDPHDRRANYGLAFFPEGPRATDADQAGCVTLAQFLQGTNPSNTQCVPGSHLVLPAARTGEAISLATPPATLSICRSAPVAATIDKIAASVVAPGGRPSALVLVTDGAENCDGLPVGAIGRLAAAGVRTHVIGLGALAAPAHAELNNLACAGRTAAGFSAACTLSENNYVARTPTGATPLYRHALDGRALTEALSAVRDGVACPTP
jgi:hypothetical protein